MTHHQLEFVSSRSDLANAVSGSYDPLLVALSVAIAIVMGFAALVVAERVRRANSRFAQTLWLGVGGLVMGSGIWAMHFVGMLAFELPFPVRYQVGITLLSVVPAALAGGAGLLFVGRNDGFWQLNGAGLLIAAGIGSMHYIGMAAMVMDAQMLYEPALFAASIAVAHALATLSLYTTFLLRKRWGSRSYRARGIGGIGLGCAVAGMHYMAMAAAVYIPVQCAPSAPLGLAPDGLVFGVTIASLLVLGATAIAAVLDQRLETISESLRVAEDGSRLIVDAAGEAIVVIDERGGIRAFNRAAVAIFGFSAEEALGKNVSCLMPEAIAAQHDAHLRRFLATRQSIKLGLRREVTGRRKDGTEFPLSLLVSDLVVGGRTVFTGVIQDLTQQRMLEAKLVHAQKLESIGQLASGIAHEINTPAQFVSDNLEFLDQSFATLGGVLEEYEGVAATAAAGPVPEAQLAKLRAAIEAADVEFLREEIPRALTQAREGVTRVSGIVRAMKEFSHPGSEGMKPTDLNRALESTLTVARNEWKYVADVTLELDPSLPAVPCLAAELNQVFLNIIVNAAQAIAELGRAEKGKILIRTRLDGDFACVEISDDGPGVPEAIRSRVFDPFFTTKEVGKGSGQGLAIAHAVVVAKHHGTLEVLGGAGEGATFLIRLPLSAEGIQGVAA